MHTSSCVAAGYRGVVRTWAASRIWHRKYVDVDPQTCSKDISQKTSRASRLPKFFIFFKKTTSVAGTFKKDQVQKFCSSQKLEHPQVEIFESKKVGQNPEIFQWKVNVNRKSRKL